jgi:hypothetical protein
MVLIFFEKLKQLATKWLLHCWFFHENRWFFKASGVTGTSCSLILIFVLKAPEIVVKSELVILYKFKSLLHNTAMLWLIIVVWCDCWKNIVTGGSR